MSDVLAAVQEQTSARSTPATVGSYQPERRLTGAQLAGYLDRHVFAVVGSTRPDGRPHAAMSGYYRRGADFWLPTVRGSVRERNVRSQPWVTLVVTEGEHHAHVVVLVGPAISSRPHLGASCCAGCSWLRPCRGWPARPRARCRGCRRAP